MRPFLKWPGGKYRLLGPIQEVLPEGRRLVEPFLGSGAVFLNTNYKRYLLSDTNLDLIQLYLHLQDQGLDFIRYCERWFQPANNASGFYYQCREEFNRTTDLVKKSALFLYLNRHGYNGLCRYNRSGIFNVPFGSYTKIYFPEKEMLHFHEQSKRAKFVCLDFLDVLKKTRPGDVLYCDPPYVPLSSTSCFTQYSGKEFIFEQQQQLAEHAYLLSQKGITVVISNHGTEETKQLYKHAQLRSLMVRRMISRNGAQREKVKEYLAVFEGVLW